MSLNFLGLGFTLGAQDKGLSGAIKDTSSGLMDISKSIVGISLASTKMIFRTPDFKPAIGLAHTLANDVKLTTTGMEAFGVAASKATSAGLAGLNLTDKEFRNAQGTIASTAFSMNTDVGAVTKSFAALQQAGVDVKKVGFKSFEDYQKFIEVTGTDSAAFAAAIGTMGKQMGMSNKQIKSSLTSVAALGKKFNIGREAMAGMADTVKILNENSNLLPQNWSPARMEKFLKGTTIVAGALTSIGVSADDAMAASRELTTKLLQGSKGMASLYSGLENTVPGITDVLTQNLGTFNDAFSMLQESPEQFMLRMGKVVDRVNKMNLNPETLNRFRIQMEQTLGPKAMAVFTKQGFGQLGPAIEKASQPIKDQDKALQDLSKRYQDGRTYAERFAIVQDQMHTALKRIPGVMNDGVYLAKYRDQTKSLVTEMTNLAGRGGIVGKATTMLVEFANRGVGGALAAHTKWGLALSEGIKLMQPMLQYLPALKMAFMGLMSPIGLVVGAITGLFFLFKDLAKGDKSIVRPFIAKLVQEAPAFLSKAKDVFFDVMTTAWKVIHEVISKIPWDKVGQALGDIFQKAADLGMTILGIALDFGGRILNWLVGVDWEGVGKKVGYYFGQIGLVAVGAIVKVLQNLPEIIGTIISKAVNLVTGLLDGIRDYLVKKFPDAIKPIVFIVEMFKALVKIVGGGLKLAFNAVWEILKGLVGLVKDVGGAIIDGFVAAKNAVMAVVDAAGWVGSKLASAGSAIADFFTGGESKAAASALKMNTVTDAAAKQMVDNLVQKQKEIQDSTDKHLRDLGVPTAGYVKTVEGAVIKSTDALTQYHRDATGAIVAVAVEAAKYVKAIVGGEVFSEMEKMQGQIRLMNDEAKAMQLQGDDWDKKMEENLAKGNALHEDYFKKYGVRWDVMFAQNEKLKGSYAIQGEVLKNATTQGAGYYDALIALQTKMSEQTGVMTLKLEQMREAGKSGTKDFIDLQNRVNAKLADDQKVFGEAQTVMSGNLAKAFDQYVGKAEQQGLAAERTAYMIAEAYKGSINDVLKGLPATAAKTGDMVKAMMIELGDAQNKEVNDLLAHTQLTGKALEDAVNKVKQKYIDQSADITKVIASHHDNLVAGAEQSTLDALASIQKGYGAMTKEVDVKTSQAASEIQKQFGVSADAALTSVNQIAAIDPNIFKKNMGVVKASFMGFLSEMDAKGKKLLDNTTKSFNDLWKTMNDGWKSNTKLLQDFTASAAQNVEQYWNKVMMAAGNAVVGFVSLTKQIEVSLSAMSRTLNIMDLLASPDQITRWAASVVSALSYAFRTGGASDAMISASYSKALAMAAEIQHGADPATPDTSQIKPLPSSSAITAAQALLQSINHPAWADDPKSPIPATLAEINQNLIAALAAMKQVAEGRAVSGAAKTGPNVKRGG